MAVWGIIVYLLIVLAFAVIKFALFLGEKVYEEHKRTKDKKLNAPFTEPMDLKISS